MSGFKLSRLIGLLIVGFVAIAIIGLVAVVLFEMQADTARTAMTYQNSALRIASSVVQGMYSETRVDWSEDGNVKRITLDQLPDASAMDMIDEIAHISGQQATLFSYDSASNDFIRTATSIRKADGSRAIGTKLGHGSKAYPFIAAGKPYIGKADILGQSYYTIYEPIFNTDNKVIGILFSGALAKDVQKTAEAMRLKLIVMATVLLVGLSVVASLLARTLMLPLVRLEGAVNQIAGGRYDTTVPFVALQNEVGSIARALEIFRTQGLERQTLADSKAQEDERRAQRQAHIETLIGTFRHDMQSALEGVDLTMVDILTTADDLSRASSETANSATIAGTAAMDASGNVQTVASAAEELTASIREITDQVVRANDVVSGATRVTADTNAKVENLAGAASKIGEVVGLIQAIAAQTNLLALNATIEAARAGDSGKGFAVVASEVKDLAAQTARATAEISAQIAEIQASTRDTVDAIAKITSTMTEVSHFTTAIAVAVEQQGAATIEITQNVVRASEGTRIVSDNVTSVRDEAAMTAGSAEKVAQASRLIADRSGTLKATVAHFLSDVAAA